MKIKTEQDLSCNEIEVIIKYPKKDKQVDRIIDFLQSFDMQIKCDSNDAERMINILDIYYIESVDKKTYVYLENTVYHTNFRLYQLKDKLQEYGFVQISKSCILNINALESMKPLFNSRMEATLKNGEKVTVNRNYLNGVKKALEGDKKA
ncbi:MAG: LytTR family transcriptional regulator [Lachnospiraceae bacterium]|nr:LytTR family transcriptional regulator [Lachnospiraceae bacterium]